MSRSQQSRPDPAAPAGFDQLAADIREQRKYGQVYVGLLGPAGTPDPTPIDVADRLVASLGLRPLGAGWRPVSQTEARRIARDVLKSDLAYHTEIMPAAQAEALLDRFLAFFREPLAFFTNTHPIGSSMSMTPITAATFDEGLIVVDRDRAGILWVADED